MNDEHTKVNIKQIAEELYKEFALSGAGTQSFPKTSSYNLLLRKAVNVACKSVEKNLIDHDDFYGELRGALCAVKGICDALNPEPDKGAIKEVFDAWEANRHKLWWHGNPELAFEEGFQSSNVRFINQEALALYAIDYLKLSWFIDEELEWMMVDALVFNEVCRFGEALKEHMYQTYLGHGLSTLLNYHITKGTSVALRKYVAKHKRNNLIKSIFTYGIIPFVVYGLIYTIYQPSTANNLGLIYIAFLAGALSLTKVLSQFLRPIQHSETVERFIAMWPELTGAYGVLAMHPRNPIYIKAILLSAVNKGAIWNSVIFALLERALERNRILWESQDSEFS